MNQNYISEESKKNEIKNNNKGNIPSQNKNDKKMDNRIISKSKEHKIEIVRECYIKDSNANLPEEIIDELHNSVIRIEMSEENKIYTGFFMKIILNNKQYNFILKRKKIKILLNKNKRLIKVYYNLYVVLIQILKEYNIKEKRLKIKKDILK